MDPITLMLVAAALGGLGGGVNAWGQSRQQRQQAEAQVPIRSRLTQSIERLRNPDYGQIDRAASRDYTQAVNAADAAAAQSGTLGSGAQQQMSGDILAQALANLAQFKLQDQLQREQAIAQIMQDPSFDAVDPNQIDVGLLTLMGALTGAAGGAGGAAAGIAGNPEAYAATTAKPGGKNPPIPGKQASFPAEVPIPIPNVGANVAAPMSAATPQSGSTFANGVGALLPMPGRPNVQQTRR
jgi:Na+-translocating ferredoxin:NAD+ oxidoreductase RnfG subunit